MQRCLLKDQNHYLHRLLHGQTTSTIMHVHFWLELHPLGLFCFCGSSKQQFFTRDTGFYDLLRRDDEVMTDSGFESQEDLLLYFCLLVVPPGARVKSQMTKSEVRKTKEFTKETMPVTMIQHVDDILLTYAELCSLKPKFIKNKENNLEK